MVEEGGDSACWAGQVCETCGALIESGAHACGPRPVRRTIVGFHQDDAGEWIAETSCFHAQHVRHRPPFQLRPWVLGEEGRMARVGTAIDCSACARADLPEGLKVVRTAGPFDAVSLPRALLTSHVVADGAWGYLHVAEGAVSLSMQTDPPTTFRLGAGDGQAIPPGVVHALTLNGAVRLTIDFLRPVVPRP